MRTHCNGLVAGIQGVSARWRGSARADPIYPTSCSRSGEPNKKSENSPPGRAKLLTERMPLLRAGFFQLSCPLLLSHRS
jgi:hypothetical protein